MSFLCRCQIAYGRAIPFRTGFVLNPVASDSCGAMRTGGAVSPQIALRLSGVNKIVSLRDTLPQGSDNLLMLSISETIETETCATEAKMCLWATVSERLNLINPIQA